MTEERHYSSPRTSTLSPEHSFEIDKLKKTIIAQRTKIYELTARINTPKIDTKSVDLLHRDELKALVLEIDGANKKLCSRMDDLTLVKDREIEALKQQVEAFGRIVNEQRNSLNEIRKSQSKSQTNSQSQGNSHHSNHSNKGSSSLTVNSANTNGTNGHSNHSTHSISNQLVPPSINGSSTQLRNSSQDMKNTKRLAISAEPTAQLQNSEIKVPVIPKSEANKDLIYSCFSENRFLSKLKPDQLHRLIDGMSKRKLSANVKLIKEGSEGKHLYIIEKGSVQIETAAHGLVAVLGPGKMFGELAILYNCKRTATVITREDCSLFELNRHHFKAIITSTGLSRDKEKLAILKTVKSLANLPDNKLKKICDCLEEEIFNDGDCLIKEGASGDQFYIIEQGKVNITKNTNKNTKSNSSGNTNQEELVATLGKGQYFGERALQTEDKRNANVYAFGKLKCLVLDRNAFVNLIGHLDEETSGKGRGGQNMCPTYKKGVPSEIFVRKIGVHIKKIVPSKIFGHRSILTVSP